MSICFAPTGGCRIEEVPPPDSTFEVGGPSLVPSPPSHLLGHEVMRLREDTKRLYGSEWTLKRGMRTCQTKIATTRTEVDRIRRSMDAFNVDLAFIEQDATKTSDDVLALQACAETVEAKQLQA
ncbi:hypothetical protein Tco_0111986 [Tanacetum coccineum]